MPTQEERLTKLEFDLRQFKTETIKAYGDMAFEMTIVKGLTENAIGRLAALSDMIEKRFERVDIRLDAMDAHLENMDKRFTSTDQQLAEVKQDLAEMKQNINDHTTRLDRIESLLTQIVARLPEKP